jgi:hypothetical protein
MPDMLVRLYDLPDASTYYRRVEEAGIVVRRAEPWERLKLQEFVRQNFNEVWPVEADRCFNFSPITGFVGTLGGEIVGFAVYECTRPNFFGPTGVKEDLRGTGLGAALLFRCLESMREMSYGYAVIGWAGPAEFYERTCGAFIIPGSEVSVFGPLREAMARPEPEQ